MKRVSKGFTTLELLLVVVLLAIVGFTGYHVWQSKQQTDKLLNSAQDETSAVKITKNTSSGSKNTVEQKYFTISQWGVRAPYDGTLTLEYALVKATSTVPESAKISSAELDALGTNCKQEADFGGIISRYQSTQDVILEDGTDSGKTATQFAATFDPTKYAHVGNYYYFYSGPQALCPSIATDDTTGAAIQGSTQQDAAALVPKLEAIPAQ